MIIGLERLPIELPDADPPKEDLPLIKEAAELSERFTSVDSPDRVPSLVSSGGLVAWKFLEAASVHLAQPPLRFCEWGSGVGLVTCLAARRGWQAVGLEIEPKLVAAARGLATTHAVKASFQTCSYKPDAMFDQSAHHGAFDTGLGFGLFDFDIVYTYFWPAERDAMTAAFARHAKPGTVLLRYGGGLQCELFRKAG